MSARRNKKKRQRNLLLQKKNMSFSKLEQIVQGLTYKPGWRITPYDCLFGSLEVFVSSAEVECVNKLEGEKSRLRGPSVKVEKHWTEEKIVYEIYKKIEAIEMHELDEWFQQQGRKVYDPHTPAFQRVA